MSTDKALENGFKKVGTPTVAGVLQKMGIRKTFMERIAPIDPNQRMFGVARTIRHLPMREDLVPPPEKTNEAVNRRGLTSIGPGEVVVYDLMGLQSAGGPGNVVAAYLKNQGAAGMVVHGALRDIIRCRAVGLPVYAGGVHGANGTKEVIVMEMDVPVACGDCLVRPGDYISGDGDGVVVIPKELACEVLEKAFLQEDREIFALRKMADGIPLGDVYPPLPEYQEEFERERDSFSIA
jgi:regulator of RNase E activity RraA